MRTAAARADIGSQAGVAELFAACARRTLLPGEALFRSHLRPEAKAFARGDYADPAAIHGAGMPGLQELQAGAARVRVAYEPVPGGARMRFSSRDPALVVALHRWFAAQLSDHGADATTGR